MGEFRGFLLKTNALALAVGVIIGTALGTVVNSLVNDIIMPPVGLLLGGVDFSLLVIKLKERRSTPPARPCPRSTSGSACSSTRSSRSSSWPSSSGRSPRCSSRSPRRPRSRPARSARKRTRSTRPSARPAPAASDRSRRIFGGRERPTDCYDAAVPESVTRTGPVDGAISVASRCKGPRCLHTRAGAAAWPP